MRKFILTCLTFGLVSCGGGGGSDAIPIKPISIDTSSYINVKNLDFHSMSFPQQSGQALRGDAQVFFTQSQGQVSLFLARLQYSARTHTPSLAPASTFEFYRLAADNWVQYNPKIDRQADNCLHPRKAITADFNLDGIVDIVVACHGYDGDNYPGEFSIILLSTGPDQYVQRAISNSKEFYHSVSAADLNQDGKSDLVFALGQRGLAVYINDGMGNFKESKDYIVGTQGTVYTVELMDVNNDSKSDLVIGGHEWETSSRLVLKQESNRFDLSSAINIVPVPGAGVVLDFVFANSKLYILRTGDPTESIGNFYKGLYLQQFSIQDRTSQLIVSDANWQDNRYTYPANWLNWVRYYDGYIVSLWGQAIKIRII